MNTKEYEQKKQECWAVFKKQSECEGGCLMADAFFHAFDRAYALGKQEKDTEESPISGRLYEEEKSQLEGLYYYLNNAHSIMIITAVIFLENIANQKIATSATRPNSPIN